MYHRNYGKKVRTKKNSLSQYFPRSPIHLYSPLRRGSGEYKCTGERKTIGAVIFLLFSHFCLMPVDELVETIDQLNSPTIS